MLNVDGGDVGSTTLEALLVKQDGRVPKDRYVSQDFARARDGALVAAGLAGGVPDRRTQFASAITSNT